LGPLPEDSLIKVSSVASPLGRVSARDMLEAPIAGKREPKVLAALARGRMRVKHAALVEALTGAFDDHHAGLARMLLGQINALSAQIGKLISRVEDLVVAISAAQGIDADGTTGLDAGASPDAPALTALARLDEILGISRATAQGIIAEIGMDMTRFPAPGHLVSWAKLAREPSSPRPGTAPARPARATPISRESSARLPPQPPVLPWSSSDTCPPAAPPPSANSAPATTRGRIDKTRKPATTSANWKRSGSASPSPPQPDPPCGTHWERFAAACLAEVG
jgi:hypothetical protein